MPTSVSFGTWLKQRRKALDLTQADLAQLAACATITIRKLEADAARPSRQMAHALAHALGVGADEVQRVIHAARAGQAPVVTRTAAADPRSIRAGDDLPHTATRLLGRDTLVAAVAAQLRCPDVRLLTLTGPGGIGKTRLALAVAETVRDTFRDGVTFVDLAPVRDPAHVLSALALAVGVPDSGGRPPARVLHEALRDQQRLVLLDNFEHVLEAALDVAALLAAAAGITVLVTSRSVLHLYGEHEVPVPPLALPAAIALFTARAHAARPAFSSGAEHETIRAICVRLDGVPLAIELAAARVKLFSATALLQRLEQQVSFLRGGPRDAPARQQTLRSTLDWSYRLLDSADQRLFRWLGVFVGGWTLGTALAVCHAEGAAGSDVEAGLAHLADQSLIAPMEGEHHELRFRMLESLREYAREHLLASGDAAVLRQRHAAVFDRLVQQLDLTGKTGDLGAWRSWLRAEEGNLRAALGWALEHGAVPTATRIGLALVSLWWSEGAQHSARQCLDALIRVSAVPPHDAAAAQEWGEQRLRVLIGAWHIAFAQRDFAAARQYAAEHLAVASALSNQFEMIGARGLSAWAAVWQGNDAEAEALLTECVAQERNLEQPHDLSWMLILLGEIAWHAAAYDRAEVLLDEARAVAQAGSNHSHRAWALRQLATVACLRGDRARAHALLTESLQQYQALGDAWGIEECLELFTWVWGSAGLQAGARDGHTLLERAARVLGATAALREATGHPTVPAYQQIHAGNAAAIRAAMGDADFEVAWTAGRAMPRDAAVAYALAEPGAP